MNSMRVQSGGSELSELLDQLDIEAYLDSQGIDYKRTRGRSGAQLNVKVCPVCGNSDSKVYLNAETGLGNCFAGSHPAGETFNKWTFIRAYLGAIPGAQVVQHIKSYVEARGYVPRRVHAAPVQVTASTTLALPDSFPLPYQGKNIQYLVNRGITDEITTYFHLRYCHEGGYPYEFDGKRHWMKFDQRVIIPVFDLDGNLVNFQGRDITGFADKKYLFPPGLASTGIHLLNGMNVRDTERVAVGEGAFDLMGMKMAFDAEPSLRDVIPVGTFGKKLSEGDTNSQLAKFRTLMERGVREVVIMWDGEIAATGSAIEAGFLLLKLGLKVRIAMLPKDKDPNEVPASVVRDAYFKAVPLSTNSAIKIAMLRRKMNS
jgi:DNA primase